jgi:hypothetical protein
MSLIKVARHVSVLDPMLNVFWRRSRHNALDQVVIARQIATSLRVPRQKTRLRSEWTVHPANFLLTKNVPGKKKRLLAKPLLDQR